MPRGRLLRPLHPSLPSSQKRQRSRKTFTKTKKKRTKKKDTREERKKEKKKGATLVAPKSKEKKGTPKVGFFLPPSPLHPPSLLQEKKINKIKRKRKKKRKRRVAPVGQEEPRSRKRRTVPPVSFFSPRGPKRRRVPVGRLLLGSKISWKNSNWPFLLRAPGRGPLGFHRGREGDGGEEGSKPPPFDLPLPLLP